MKKAKTQILSLHSILDQSGSAVTKVDDHVDLDSDELELNLDMSAENAS